VYLFLKMSMNFITPLTTFLKVFLFVIIDTNVMFYKNQFRVFIFCQMHKYIQCVS